MKRITYVTDQPSLGVEVDMSKLFDAVLKLINRQASRTPEASVSQDRPSTPVSSQTTSSPFQQSYQASWLEKQAITEIRNLGRLHTPAAQALLQARLSDSRVSVRKAVVAVLRSEDEQATSILMLALGDADATVRSTALTKLDQFGREPEIIDILLQALDDASLEVRLSAVKALGARRVHAAISPLLALLPDQPTELQREIGLALGSIGDISVLEQLRPAFCGTGTTCKALAAGISLFHDARAVDLLVARLGDKRPSVRATIAKALGNTRHPSAIAHLRNTLQYDRDEEVLLQATYSLSVFDGYQQAAHGLLDAARNGFSTRVRQAGEQALIEMESPWAAGPLLALQLNGRYLSYEAAQAYRKLAQRFPVEMLLAVSCESIQPLRQEVRWFLESLAEDQPDSARLMGWLAEEI